MSAAPATPGDAAPVPCTAILHALADLAPSGPVTLDVRQTTQDLAWLGEADDDALLGAEGRQAQLRVRPSAELRSLEGFDLIHADERLLRAGWGFLAGTCTLDGRPRTVLMPLLSRPVRIRGSAGRPVVVAAGDTELAALVTNPDEAARLEGGLPFGGDAADEDRWLAAAAAAAGFPGAQIVAAVDPRARLDDEGVVVVRGIGVYAWRETVAVGLAPTLRAWSGQTGLESTAFGAVYGAAVGSSAPTDAAVSSPLPLTSAQREVVVRARTERITVVSGAPGNGKSHALVAAAIDAVAQGASVLVATQSLHAAEVLGDLLERYPGPMPVMFGSTEHRQAIAARLSAGVPSGTSAGDLRAAERHLAEAEADERAVRGTITAQLERERLAARARALGGVVAELSRSTPKLFHPDSDHERVASLLARATAAHDGWWATRRARRAARRVRAAAGAGPAVGLDRIATALDAARSHRAAAELATYGGTRLAQLWEALSSAQEQVSLRAGALIRARADAVPPDARPAIAALGAALRAGRGTRRQMLARMEGGDLVRALPLWIGTLRDVEDLLPRTPGLFDLVILDEASQIEQVRAAPALLRARRALVAGDPRQLRHVSFVADADVARSLSGHGLDDLADRLDVRRMSALDAAAAVSAATWLDEHFRSVPHLIAFSAERFYPQPIRLVTLHPRNESVDAIETVHVEGRRDADGVNAVEVAAVADILRRLSPDPDQSGLRSASAASAGTEPEEPGLRSASAASAGTEPEGSGRTVGVITPFRAQADALERMILDRYDAAGIRRMGLRAGTVHELQGGERDVIVISLCLSADDDPAALRFLADPNLFNVMITRARAKVVVVTSLRREVGGLVGAYLAHAARSPRPADATGAVGRWTRAVHDEVRRAGLPVRAGYPVGRWALDLCVGEGESACAVECEVHPDGPEAHIRRHRTLERAGWTIAEAFASAHDHDAARAAIELTAARPRWSG